MRGCCSVPGAPTVLPSRRVRTRRTRRPLQSLAQGGTTEDVTPAPADVVGEGAYNQLPPLPPQQPLPRRNTSWSVSVQVAAPQDVFQFSGAAGAGLPLWSPAGLAITLLALVAVCGARTSRGSAVHELASVLDARRVPVDEDARTAAEETLEQLRARQQAEAKRQAEEAAQEAARVAVQQRELQAEQARIQVRLLAAQSRETCAAHTLCISSSKPLPLLSARRANVFSMKNDVHERKPLLRCEGRLNVRCGCHATLTFWK